MSVFTVVCSVVISGLDPGVKAYIWYVLVDEKISVPRASVLCHVESYTFQDISLSTRQLDIHVIENTQHYP